MKKKELLMGIAFALIGGGMLLSCGSKKQNETATEELSTEAVEESYALDEKENALDTLQQIDEMVEAVETPVSTAGINGTPYTAAFFENPANKADKASETKYAQTASGLKYVIAKQGTGKAPKASDAVTVHYVGTLTNGTQFDSSIDRGEPATFPLGAVIPGWTEGLQYMQEGGTAVFFIPANLAYGQRDLPGIPANSTLMFWVQLIQVN